MSAKDGQKPKGELADFRNFARAATSGAGQ